MVSFGLQNVIMIGIIILVLFIVLRFFKFLFSMSFIGCMLSLVSYFVYDYKFATVPIVATVALVLCVCGISKSTIFGKIFAAVGIFISGYILLRNYGILV